MDKNIIEILVQVIATIIGGIFLAILFFIYKEKINRLPSLSGLWTFKISVESSSYNPYKEMSVSYIVLLIQEGNHMSGTGEKIKDVMSGKTTEYVGKERVNIEISGYIMQRFFSADECIVHIKETGKLRDSSTLHQLKIMNDSSIDGVFVSTIANSMGRVTWKRGNDNYSFSQEK